MKLQNLNHVIQEHKKLLRTSNRTVTSFITQLKGQITIYNNGFTVRSI